MRNQAVRLISDVIEKNFEGSASKTVLLVAIKMCSSLNKRTDSPLSVWRNEEMLSMTFDTINL